MLSCSDGGVGEAELPRGAAAVSAGALGHGARHAALRVRGRGHRALERDAALDLRHRGISISPHLQLQWRAAAAVPVPPARSLDRMSARTYTSSTF